MTEHVAQNLDIHSGSQGSCGKGMAQGMDICRTVTVISGLTFVCASQGAVAAHAAVGLGNDEVFVRRGTGPATQQHPEVLFCCSVQIDLTVTVQRLGRCDYFFLRHFAGLFIDDLDDGG